MKTFSSVLLCLAVASGLPASETLDRARQLAKSGDPLGARAILARTAQSSPDNVASLTEYAEFLDRYGDPSARAVYGKLLDVLEKSGDNQRRASVAQRLVSLDLLADDKESVRKHIEIYRAAGGKELSRSFGDRAPATIDPKHTVSIPGPLRSFARMAAISSDLNLNDVLPAVARNVVTNGYQASHSNDALEQTEYLKLVHRYLSQARELEKMAGDQKTVRVENCEAPTAGELLKILGYRMRGGCGSEVVLETVNASRAFLTTDSGFPLADLEQALRTNRPFAYDYKPTQVSVLYGPEYWLSAKEKAQGSFIDAFLGDPSLCRLYLGLTKLDRDTAVALKDAVPVQRIRAYAHVLDFFGGMFEIRDGKAVIPGGARSAAVWTELVGASPDKGATFYEKLLAKDDGWVASLYDALSRINGPVQDYLTDPVRMKRFYSAVRGRVTSPGPARPVFRSNADLMLLTTRLQIGPNGKPHIPGNVEIWKNLFVHHPHGKYDGKLTKAATGWKDSDDVLEALFGLSRKAVENEPLKIFMALSDLDRQRAKPLEPATVDRMAREFRLYGPQYAIFNDAPSLTDKTILQFMDMAASVSKIKDQLLRSDAAGTVQSLVSMWQIVCRQGSLPEANADELLSGLISGFAAIKSDRDVFDGGR
ncbi:MAG: hypothetical protein ABIZ80_25345, partial [Bryobacteraceae bacterium]